MTKKTPFLKQWEKRFFIVSTGLLLILIIIAAITSQLDETYVRLVDRIGMMWGVK